MDSAFFSLSIGEKNPTQLNICIRQGSVGLLTGPDSHAL